MPFRTEADHGRLLPSSAELGGFAMPAPLQIGLLVFPKVTQLDLTGPVQVFCSLPDAKVHLVWKRIEPVAKRFRADLDADRHLRRLPAARRDLRAGRCRQRRHGQRRRGACLPAQAGGSRAIHHLGLHGIAGARRGGAVEGLSRGDALDGEGLSVGVWRDPRAGTASASTATG